MPKRRSNLALGGLLLAGLGYVAGVLTAPKSGKETRRDLKRTALKAKSEAEKNLKHVHAELNELVSGAQDKAKTLSAKAKTELQAAVKKAKQAQAKVRNVLSALHEGESDDKDLETAIEEATKAVTHLKQYVSKAKAKNVRSKKARK